MSGLDKMVERYNELLEIQKEMISQFNKKLNDIEKRVTLLESR